MPLCVLTDAQIAALLENLTLDEAESFRDVLRSALHEYSTGTQSARDSDLQQPARTSITSATTGATTLFMPSCNAEGMGMKVLTLGGTGAGSGIQSGLKSDSGGSGGSGFRAAPDAGFAPDEECARPTGAISLYARSGEPLGLLHAGTLTAFRTALTSVCLLLRRDSVRNIVVFGSGSQAYWHVRLALLFRGAGVRQVHVINRRFSDSCRRILQRFYQMPAAVRQREGWADVQFSVLTPSYVEYPRLLAQQLRSADVVFCCTPATAPLFDASILTSHEGRRKGRLLVAVGSFTHAMQELPAELLRQATGGASPSSSLPSSSSPSSPTPSSPSADRTRRRHHYHKHAVEGGVVVVDTLDGALKEAGEIQAAGLTPRQLVEIGELVMLSRIALEDDADSDDGSAELEKLDLGPSTPSTPTSTSTIFPSDSASSASSVTTATTATTAERSRRPSPNRKSSSLSRHSLSSSGLRHHHHSHRRSQSQSQASADSHKQRDTVLARWLQCGNVIYKSVGLGLMDLSVGLRLIEFARQKGVGTIVEGF